VRRQIFFCQILVGGFVASDLLPPQFLDQPILMRPVVAFYPAPKFRRFATIGNSPHIAMLQPLAALVAGELLFRPQFASHRFSEVRLRQVIDGVRSEFATHTPVAMIIRSKLYHVIL